MTPLHYLVHGDCRDVLATWPEGSITAVITDPPYGLSREPDALEVLRHWLAGDDYRHDGGGFMGKSWDSFVPGPSIWRAVFRVLKPGGHVLSFSGTRTYDLATLAMRIAGFEIRDELAWLYGSGFPKSLDVARVIADAQGLEKVETPHPTNACPGGQWCTCGDRDERAQSGATRHPPQYTYPEGSDAEAWDGWGTALKPAHEPIVLARKPLVGTVAANVTEYGTGALNIDGCRIGDAVRFNPPEGNTGDTPASYAPVNVTGYEGTTTTGRWPANVLLDETSATILDEQTGDVKGQQGRAKTNGSEQTRTVYGSGRDNGGPSRFFYCAKASKAEREAGLAEAGLPIRSGGDITDRVDGSDGLNSPRAGAGRGGGRRNHHPTVKPIALMRYLCRLIGTPGGMILDPFAGSGSTLCAAILEGFNVVGVELTAEYLPIIEGRVAAARAGKL